MESVMPDLEVQALGTRVDEFCLVLSTVNVLATLFVIAGIAEVFFSCRVVCAGSGCASETVI